MNKFLSTLALTGVLFVTSISAQAADMFKLDPVHTSVVFKVNHLGIANMFGRFNTVSGEFTVDQENPSASSVRVVIMTESVDTNFKERDAHLRSPDFFNAIEFPEMTFVSTRIVSGKDKTAKVTGTLTMLGVSKEITLDAILNMVGNHPMSGEKVAGLSARGTLKRSEFGMKYGVPNISDEIELFLEVEGTLK